MGYRIKKVLTPISSISLTLSSSSPEISSSWTTNSSNTSSTISDVTDASISSKRSSSGTDSTLGMITTPWTTESWSGESVNETIEAYSETVMNTLTSLTVNPESTESIGGVTSELNTASINTVTLLERNEPISYFSVNLNSVPSESTGKLKMKTKAKSYSEIESTFDSWTVESFTSFVEYSDSNIVKVRYPWSPCTYLSSTDIYPDSMDTFRSSVISLINSPTLDSTHETVRYYINVLHESDIICS
nr:uncharacterized serine-rich protein C215.13-like [Maniola hyperantus]